MRDVIGQYRIIEPLGEGGMGVVFSARDERLDRPVAIKMIRPSALGDPIARERFWREARAVAGLNHPGICQLYEVGEDNGELFLAMELLEGEPLDRRLKRGALPVDEGIPIAIAVLAALEAIHRRGLIHRDLKPSNVFLTAAGVKLLDFGLARPVDLDSVQTSAGLTLPGVLLGTPAYMAPELLLGHSVDHRADLFAAGAIVFEMLAGRLPFTGGTVVELTHAIVHDRAPMLSGSSAIAAVDRIVHRALAKKPTDRFPSADAMAQALRETLLLSESGEVARARTVNRLVVLPFRLLRPDADTEFLSFGLADALTMSLAGLESIVLRSALAATRFAGEQLDLKAIASELEVDSVLTGTLLRSGEHLRVSTQLLQVPDGTLIASHSAKVALGDVFQVQDQLASQIVESLALPLSARERDLIRQDIPSNAKAYEFYLRANQMSYKTRTWEAARDLYLRSLEEDAQYAPAWARLGRIYRVLAKFVDASPDENEARAESALRRALQLNPELPIAHKIYAHHEIDSGRARDAMLRLIERVKARSTDAELFAALSQACRYCGLLDASVAAATHALRLDPNVQTSLLHTYWMMGEYQHALDAAVNATDTSVGYAHVSLGNLADAVAALKAEEARFGDTGIGWFSKALRLAVEGDQAGCRALGEAFRQSRFKDPEGIFYAAVIMTYANERELALEFLEKAVQTGFFCYPVLARQPWFDSLRAEPAFNRALREAEGRWRDARTAYIGAGGEQLLGAGTA